MVRAICPKQIQVPEKATFLILVNHKQEYICFGMYTSEQFHMLVSTKIYGNSKIKAQTWKWKLIWTFGSKQVLVIRSTENLPLAHFTFHTLRLQAGYYINTDLELDGLLPLSAPVYVDENHRMKQKNSISGGTWIASLHSHDICSLIWCTEDFKLLAEHKTFPDETELTDCTDHQGCLYQLMLCTTFTKECCRMTTEPAMTLKVMPKFSGNLIPNFQTYASSSRVWKCKNVCIITLLCSWLHEISNYMN